MADSRGVSRVLAGKLTEGNVGVLDLSVGSEGRGSDGGSGGAGEDVAAGDTVVLHRHGACLFQEPQSVCAHIRDNAASIPRTRQPRSIYLRFLRTANSILRSIRRVIHANV